MKIFERFLLNTIRNGIYKYLIFSQKNKLRLKTGFVRFRKRKHRKIEKSNLMLEYYKTNLYPTPLTVLK